MEFFVILKGGSDDDKCDQNFLKRFNEKNSCNYKEPVKESCKNSKRYTHQQDVMEMCYLVIKCHVELCLMLIWLKHISVKPLTVNKNKKPKAQSYNMLHA